MKIFTTRKAEDDLLTTYSFLVERNRSAAEDFIRSIDAKFENLSRFPFIGREGTVLASASAVSSPELISFSTSSTKPES